MPMRFTSKGDFNKFEKFAATVSSGAPYKDLEKYAQMGVAALRAATPVESGQAAASWGYTITRSRGGATIAWTNTDKNGGYSIIVGLQYGHGTGTGGYVPGRDFINPALKPVLDQMVNNFWRVVTA